ncbi:class I SAM-dependent DNA methyltransferase [Frigoriflavimonas asaccharolytica]|uniref:SAM-dependent methyltransferase n=1 Tax=Frigoriflavimonas asaccharolytica TaxID=2735899 RepID=A0A8J8KCR3_9FLAO|nr:class I SAM-dependent methyltransferase [Frigoriflavimonas asaccharolytica]NRS93934.1 SAM-dependent methyltransferase [Frigoriflavimonas asaccharolytica]
MKEKFLKYYNQLAPTYDENRFENSYGKYIDAQERYFLNKFFSKNNRTNILDLGCGTGRLLNFATHGLDFSAEMLKVAKEKFADKNLKVGEISSFDFDVKFDCIFCFHVIMHQTKEETGLFLKECSRNLTKNGFLIFDYPTKSRSKKENGENNWHAKNTFSEVEIFNLVENDWKIIEKKGVLLFPIHQISKKLRILFLPLDILLCKTFFKKWASYNIVVLQRK